MAHRPTPAIARGSRNTSPSTRPASARLNAGGDGEMGVSPTVKAADIRVRLGLRPVINVSGTMTSLGASIAAPEVVEAVSAILREFVEIDDLQRRASSAIARLCGAEAGFVTASCSAGITLSVAGA